MASPTINGGHLHYRRHKKKQQPLPTVAQLSHKVQLKRDQIENYKRCYTNIESQPPHRQASYQRGLGHLQAQLSDLEAALQRHPEIHTQV